jgi:hypothetical protein
VLHEIEDVLLGDAPAGARATHLCEIHVVFAGELADERRGANVGTLFVITLRSADGGCGRRSFFSSFLFCGCGSSGSGSRGLGGCRGGSAVAVADHSDHCVDLNRAAFGNLDFLKDSTGGRGDFSVNLVGGNLKQGFVALDLFTSLFQPLGDGPFEN